jgi:tetratricopeptide (TPR) repeat protein
MIPTFALEERIRSGRHSILVGPLPALDPSFEIVTIRCDAPTSTFGPLERACTRIDALLGHGPLLERARDRLANGLRRKLLVSLPWQMSELGFVDACNRLAHHATGRAAVLFEAFDIVDDATFSAIRRIVREPGWLKLPLILAVRGEPDDAVTALASALRADADDEVVLRSPPLNAPARKASATSDDRHGQIDDLPPEVRRVLRAAAVAGPVFEADLVAELLGEPTERVLEALQLARDRGFPIDDRTKGTVVMPAPLAKILVDETLPSLRARWNERLAAILDEGESLLGSLPLSAPPGSSPEPSETSTRPPDALRAAEHLTAAGQRTRSIARRLDAVAALSRGGDGDRAAEQLARTMQSIEQLPPTKERALLTARALLEQGRLAWLSLCPAPSLSEALDVLESAREALPADAPPRLQADVTAAIAGVLYDIGGSEEKARALSELSEWAGKLLENGAEVEAARLAADEAALRLRTGETERAVPLLELARGVFDARLREAPGDTLARAEIADIEHTLARLPLYATPSRERAVDLYRAAHGHAAAAERAYTSLGLRRELPRVWETMARLESRIGEQGPAEAHFAAALRAEEALGDSTGLARSTAALAEILLRKGSIPEALQLLLASIQINEDRGSIIGLAANARVLEELRCACESSRRADDATLRESLARATRTLAEARQRLGDRGQPRFVGAAAAPSRQRPSTGTRLPVETEQRFQRFD